MSIGTLRRRGVQAGRLFALLVVAAALLACAPLPRTPDAPAAPRVELTEVPFFPQEDYQCGPAALATVLVWSGLEDITPQALVPDLMIPARKGSLQIELQAQARAHDRVAYLLQGDLQSLYAELKAGHPVLVLQNLAFDWSPVWHYAVVIGHDPQQGTVLLRSGREARRLVGETTFERTWARARFWALLVLPPGELPATATPARVLEVAAELEQLRRWSLAEAWYRAAAKRWPERPAFALGVANSQYSRGDLQAAEQGLRSVIERFPTEPAGYNNLAWLLAQSGRWEEAEPLLQQGLALTDGQDATVRAELEDTRRFIECRGKTSCLGE